MIYKRMSAASPDQEQSECSGDASRIFGGCNMNDNTDIHTQGDAIPEIDTSPVEFSSDVDAKFYTLQDYTPTSVAEQEVGYLLDIRNILLIAILGLVIFRSYQMLKNNIIAYFN